MSSNSRSTVLSDPVDLSRLPYSWETLILPYIVKENLTTSIINPIEKEQELEDRGIILFGPPGTGKTSIPFSIGRKYQWPVYYVSPRDFIQEHYNFKVAIKQCFEDIRNIYENNGRVLETHGTKKIFKNKIIFVFDEIDELVVTRNSEQDRDTRLMTTMMLPLFNELRSNADEHDFLFFTQTNHIRRYDPAIARKGRFDLILPIGPPDRLDRYNMFKSIISRLKQKHVKTNFPVEDCENLDPVEQKRVPGFKKSVDLNTLATVSQRLTYGDIQSVCNRAIEEQKFLHEIEYGNNLERKPVKINTFQFLRWINKQRNSNYSIQNEIDQYYEDLAIYSRGSSPNTELNQIQQNVSIEFESIVIDDAINIVHNNGITEIQFLFQILNLNETNSLEIEKIEIVIEGDKFQTPLSISDHEIRKNPVGFDQKIEAKPGAPYLKILELSKKLEEGDLVNVRYCINGTFLLNGLAKDSGTLSNIRLNSEIRRKSSIIVEQILE